MSFFFPQGTSDLGMTKKTQVSCEGWTVQSPKWALPTGTTFAVSFDANLVGRINSGFWAVDQKSGNLYYCLNTGAYSGGSPVTECSILPK